MSAITAAVDDYVSRLKCRSDEQRVQAAQELSRFVSYDLKEVPPEATQLFYEKFDRALFELAYSQESSDMKAAIFIIVCLAKDERNVDTARLIRHANYLRNMLPSTDASVMEMAARAGGYMALWSSGLYASEYLDFEMKCAFEWLQATNADKSDLKRLAAVLILKELADVTPTFFFQHVSAFFDCIFGAIKDSRASTRENAVSALRAALVVTSQRETEQQQKDYFYKLCYEEALHCFNEAKTAQHIVAEDRMHSGLLIVNELLRSANVEWESRLNGNYVTSLFKPLAISSVPASNQRDTDDVISRLVAPFNVVLFESKTCRTQVSENYDEICMGVLRCRSAKSIYNMNIILQLIPRLVAFNVAAFDAKRNAQYEASLFKFIALMTRALKQDAEPQLRHLIEPMLSSGLSTSLISALLEIAECMPSLNMDIQDGLLRQLYQVLLRCPVPSKLLPPPLLEAPQMPMTITDPVPVTLALKVLNSFTFQTHSLEVFLKHVSEGYLNCVHVDVRLESVRCIAHILVPFVENFAKVRVIQDHLPLLRLIGDVLTRLVTAGVTDQEKIIRLTVLKSMSENELFYPHLAQAELLQLLSLALQDEDYEIRELVVSLVCRLSGINPALVMPTLRRVLLQIYSALMYSGLSRSEEQSARLFTQLAGGAPKFMKPYMQSAYEILIPKLKSSSQSDVVISTLNAIGELANIVSAELPKQLKVLMPILIEFLQDSSSYQKRKMTVWTLGKIVESTGYVMKPFQEFPELLGILLRFLKTEQMREIRREVRPTIRVLGFIGALDPYKQKVYSGAVDTAANSTGLALSMPDVKDIKDPKQEITQWFHWERCSLEEYYPALALVNLMSILSDASLSQHHTIVVNAALLIFKALNLKCLPFMDQVIPNFIKVIRTSDLNMRMFLFQQLGVLTSVVKQHIKPYLKEIFDLIKEFWSPDAPIRLTIIMLVEQLAMALGSEFKPYVAEIIPPMLRVFVHDSSDGLGVTAKLLDAFQATALVLEPYFHLILPPMLKLFYRPNVPLIVRKLAIDTVDILGENMSLSSYASRIMQAVIRALDLVPELHVNAMNLICTLVIHMGSGFLVFRTVVDSAMTRNHIVLPRYEALINRVLQGVSVDPLKDVYYRKKIRERHERIVREQLMAETELKNAPCNYMCLQKAWDVSRCVSKDDWIDWLNRFSIELLKESPFPALRACHSVAQNYYPLARRVDLFNPAFASCWTELPDNYQNELTMSLQQALSCDGSPEITQTILNLAEFLDHSDKGALPVDSKLLGRKAIETRAYAKALRYEENEFLHEGTPEILESLISINNMLQLQEASIGVVEYARKKDIKVSIKERWYEKLHDWEKALDAYERKQEMNANDMELTLGRMRCLEALGDW
ncbi:unnamed protein product [Soboliphyme baturini]|uniref:Serine/threonine-protein kinase TOR n=1 Tax=Soboliphyme baturini TaxID=241478 RepID=A0A183IRV4_9BILA|nr:unnamed protein product [Soboliphyme baturini]